MKTKIKILIAKTNSDFFKKYNQKFKFIEASKNTYTFNIDEKDFINLYEYIKDYGYNPFALMYW